MKQLWTLAVILHASMEESAKDQRTASRIPVNVQNVLVETTVRFIPILAFLTPVRIRPSVKLYLAQAAQRLSVFVQCAIWGTGVKKNLNHVHQILVALVAPARKSLALSSTVSVISVTLENFACKKSMHVIAILVPMMATVL